MRRNWLLVSVVTAIGALCLADCQTAEAQLFRRGRAGMYSGGGAYTPNGYYGNGYYGNGYYGNGAYGPGNGYYGNGSYVPGNGYNNFNNSGSQGRLLNNNTQGYQSNYPSGVNQGDVRSGNQAFILVRVPTADAQVWFDDHRTQQQGMQRSFESPPLESGKYTYQIRAKWRQNGRDMNKTRSVQVRPGQSVTVDFAQNAGQQAEQLDNQPARRTPAGERRERRNEDE